MGKIRAITRDDMGDILSWYRKRKQPVISEKMFPDTGYIYEGIAAVFIYLTNSDIALIEELISDPDTDKDVRGSAVEQLVEFAFKEAKKQRGHVVAIIRNQTVKDLALRTGYESLGNFEMFVRG